MRKPKTDTAKPEPIATPLPDWITETPVFQYTLEAFFDQDIEQVELSLEEYEQLKRTVAKMRGYLVPKEFGRRHS